MKYVPRETKAKRIKRHADTTVRIIFENDPYKNIGLDFASAEVSGMAQFDFVAVMTKTIVLLKKRRFDFSSREGRMLLIEIQQRFLRPHDFSYTPTYVASLEYLLARHLNLDIITLTPLPPPQCSHGIDHCNVIQNAPT